MRSKVHFIGSLFTARILGFVALIGLAVLAWSFGADLAIAGLRPLATDAVRISAVTVLVVFAVVWLLSGPLRVVAVAVSMLLVWHAGPLLALGGVRPLEPLWVRIVILVAVTLVCVLYGMWRLLIAMRENEAFLTSILSIGRRRDTDVEPAHEELREVGRIVRDALAQLRALRLHDSVWGRIVERHRYLYELPWFLILGGPGAGKTTALRSAGLQFPVSDRIDWLPRGTRSGADGRTRHCDWWMTNEAVLIDTAGKYAIQDGDPVKDFSEWRGFLALLRKHRPRAPINGAIVVLSMAELLQMTAQERGHHAAQLGDRLAELRQRLGIRFPVYVVVTKMDVLRGFTPYFQPLTSDSRTQAWGFALSFRRSESVEPTREVDASNDGVGEGLRLLEERLADGLRARISEEFDIDRRRMLFALPKEFSAAGAILREVLDPLRVDSRFDSTQATSMLRGVYFTSAAQADVELPADPQTLVRRLRPTSADGHADAVVDTRPSQIGHGFFIHDVLKKVVFPEAHLVRPNLRWEARNRAIRAIGHLAVFAIFVWLAMALTSSYANNRDYLSAFVQRVDALAARARPTSGTPTPEATFELLDAARDLTDRNGPTPSASPMNFRYGLYSIAAPAEAASRSYADLQSALLFPVVLRRLEQALSRSLETGDSRLAYETLRVYKLLHDRQRYVQAGGEAAVRDWLRTDAGSVVDASRGTNEDRIGMSGRADRASMASHLDALFSGNRVVQAASPPDEALVRAVQRMLGDEDLTQRLYGRAKAVMQADAPPEFTLLRAVGPQVGTVFARKGGLPLDKGVPGLFTHDGYRRRFVPLALGIVRKLLDEDHWVMGDARAAVSTESVDTWVSHVRQLYLNEYARNWEDFLGSVRIVGSVDAAVIVRKSAGPAASAAGLGFELNVLRQLASPDSPLSRLARAAVRETTLSHAVVETSEDRRTPLDGATAAIAASPAKGEGATGTSDRQLETELVDNRFAALREVVTGSADALPTARLVGTSGARASLDTIAGLLNDFYTWMVVADTTLSAGGVPPGGVEAATRLRIEAGRLPAPFRAILADVAEGSGEKVMLGASAILRRQAQVQVDRLAALLAVQVSEPCKRALEGRYPFIASGQDASIDDFAQLFAAGGVLDEYFTKYLAPWVDTSARTWRYRSADSAVVQAVFEASSAGGGLAATPTPTAVASAGPTLIGEVLGLLASDGPRLEPFQRARQIRDLFFREAGGRKMAWKMDFTVRELEPSITELMMDIDGQSQRYVHGPVQPLAVVWPGPRGGAGAEITAQPRISAGSSSVLTQGPWALFRLLDKGRLTETATPGRMTVEFVFDGRKAVIELGTGSQPNPLNSDLLKGFRCPGRTA
ncbi:MAG: type VI secretion system membrane subunit TssM [Variovorax sp.]|nr:MAG: type VI secretion system membrane subunit TssM [Variovorax sp.]